MTNLLKTTKSILSKLYNKAAKNMSSKSSIDLLHNKTVLYGALLVSIVNLMLWMIAGDMMNVIVFALVGFLTAFFSKNMIVILVFSLVVSNIVKYGIEIGQEGFKGDAKKGIDDDVEDEKDNFQEGGDAEEEADEKDNFQDVGAEGMQTLGFSDYHSMMSEQHTLFSNISKLTPFVVNVDNEAKLRTSLKYEGFTAKPRK